MWRTGFLALFLVNVALAVQKEAPTKHPGLIPNRPKGFRPKDQQLQLVNCSQSSTHPAAECDKATDGNTDQHLEIGQSCSATAETDSPWWAASTEEVAHIGEIRIFNRIDCCFDRLTDFVISVDGQECASYNSTDFLAVKTFQCDRAGQLVMIRSRKATVLNLCEVQVFGSIIQRSAYDVRLKLHSCSQSSTLSNAECGRAIDGSTNVNFESGHACSATTDSTNPTWSASTVDVAHIRSVRIFNRVDCCMDRLTNFAILVDDQECASYDSPETFTVKTFQCDRVGQLVTIRSRKATVLNLCEVHVFGALINNRPEHEVQLKLNGCSQSSTDSGAGCGRAVDGNTDLNLETGQSCSATLKSASPWWTASTVDIAHISEIRIFNRIDCCSDRLINLVISVDDQECASYNSTEFVPVKAFKCNRAGQVIMIRSSGFNVLNLCEVQAFGEIIKRSVYDVKLELGSCSQSSIWPNAECSKAIDGNTNQHFESGQSCSATADTENQWWAVSTIDRALITEVRIFNRIDCCPDRLTNFAITVDDQECASYNSPEFFSVKTFRCDRVGQVVMIQSRLPTALNLCEVQIFGRPIGRHESKFQLKLESCSQSSTWGNAKCVRAIDGNTNQNLEIGKSCSATTDSANQWWTANTVALAHIREIRIFNRVDCCFDRLTKFVITVDDQECVMYDSPEFFAMKSFKCNLVGQVVMIRSLKATALNLCEVQVFGKIASSPYKKVQLQLRSCLQSSTHASAACSRAIDGDTNMNFETSQSCSATTDAPGQWWRASTERIAHIREIRIFNRVDCCMDGLTNFVITVDNQECASYDGPETFSVKSFECNRIGRVVMIKSRRATALHLCEVQVFGKVAVHLRNAYGGRSQMDQR